MVKLKKKRLEKHNFSLERRTPRRTKSGPKQHDPRWYTVVCQFHTEITGAYGDRVASEYVHDGTNKLYKNTYHNLGLISPHFAIWTVPVRFRFYFRLSTLLCFHIPRGSLVSVFNNSSMKLLCILPFLFSPLRSGSIKNSKRLRFSFPNFLNSLSQSDDYLLFSGGQVIPHSLP